MTYEEWDRRIWKDDDEWECSWCVSFPLHEHPEGPESYDDIEIDASPEGRGYGTYWFVSLRFQRKDRVLGDERDRLPLHRWRDRVDRRVPSASVDISSYSTSSSYWTTCSELQWKNSEKGRDRRRDCLEGELSKSPLSDTLAAQECNWQSVTLAFRWRQRRRKVTRWVINWHWSFARSIARQAVRHSCSSGEGMRPATTGPETRGWVGLSKSFPIRKKGKDC